MSRLKDLYKNEIMDAMTKKFGYKNVMEVPKLEKIVVNMGVGEAKENAKLLDAAIADMELVTGQKAIATKAKKSVANFKIREGMPIGCKVTLRGEKMYEFADRLINLIVLNLWEDQLLFDTKSIVSSAVECVRVNTTEVTYTRKCKVDQTISELVHFFSS